MKKAGIANAPRPSLEAPGESVNHTSVILNLFLLPKLHRTIRLMIYFLKKVPRRRTAKPGEGFTGDAQPLNGPSHKPPNPPQDRKSQSSLVSTFFSRCEGITCGNNRNLMRFKRPAEQPPVAVIFLLLRN